MAEVPWEEASFGWWTSLLEKAEEADAQASSLHAADSSTERGLESLRGSFDQQMT